MGESAASGSPYFLLCRGDGMKTKKCKKCGVTKSVDYFYKCNKSADGYQSYCKVCNRVKRDKK